MTISRQKAFYDLHKTQISEKYFKKKYSEASIDILENKLNQLKSNLACIESLLNSRSNNISN